MKNLFINPVSGLLRSGWRLASFAILFMAFNAILMFGVRSILGGLPAAGTLWFLLLGLAATLAVYITTKYISQSSFTELGLRFDLSAVKDLFVGIGISAIIMALMFFLLLSLGYIRYDGLSWWTDKEHAIGVLSSTGLIAMLAVLFQFTIVAWWEELAFRGIILQYISTGLNLRWGVIISTLGFGLIHAGNPSATTLSTILIMLITIKLVYAYLKSGQLWLPIGLHLGWTFFQASILGFASSGHVSPSLMAQTPIGPDWLSGGSFGAENSIFIIPLTLASLFAMHWWIRYSRNLSNYKLFDFIITNETFKN